MELPPFDRQFIIALEHYPFLTKVDDFSFSICFPENPNEHFFIKYDPSNIQNFPAVTQNESDITKICQFYINKNFTLLDIIQILDVHIKKHHLNKENPIDKNISELQIAANKLATDISLKTNQINGIQRRMIRCSSSVPDLYHLTKKDEARMLKTEVVEMKQEIEILKADIESETKQFKDYLRQIAELIKKTKLSQNK